MHSLYAYFAKEISTISHRAEIKINVLELVLERSSTDSEQCVLPAHLQFVIKRDEREKRLARRDASARFHFPAGSRAFAANNRPASISVTNRAHNKTLFFTVSVAERERDGATKERRKKRERERKSIERAFHGASERALRTDPLNFTLARYEKNPRGIILLFLSRVYTTRYRISLLILSAQRGVQKSLELSLI